MKSLKRLSCAGALSLLCGTVAMADGDRSVSEFRGGPDYVAPCHVAPSQPEPARLPRVAEPMEERSEVLPADGVGPRLAPPAELARLPRVAEPLESRSEVFYANAIVPESAAPPAKLNPLPRVDERLAGRVKELETEQQMFREELRWRRDNPSSFPEAPSFTEAKTTPAGMMRETTFPETIPEEETYFSLDELKAEMKKLAWTKGDFRIVPYGYLWADMVYGTERTNPGAYTLWVHSADTHGEDMFVIDARRTRVGVNIEGPAIPLFGCAKSGAKVEIDFEGAFVTENKAGVLLRHIYWEAKDEDCRILVGQTWDVISPLNPGTLSYSVGWIGGNIGYRRAQFRLERYLRFSDVSMMQLQGSLNAGIVSDFATTAGVVREPSDWPVVEGRVGWVLGRRGKGSRPVTFGLSGHIGETGFDFTRVGPPPLNLPPADDQRFRTWSLNADVRVPITDRLGIQGEFFTGENLSSFLGGIGQGVCPCNRRTVRSTGGWIDLWYDWTDRLHSHAGWGLDDPIDNDFLVGRTYNQFIFANVSFDITKQFTTGLEVTSWKTLYQDVRLNPLGPTAPGESVTFEWMVRYGF